MAKKAKPTPSEPQDPHEGPPPYNLLGCTAPFKAPEFAFRISAWVGKGGTGKTAGSAGHLALAQKAGAAIVMLPEDGTIPESRGHSVIPFDLDPANPSMQRYLADFSDRQVCGTIDVYESGQLMQAKLLPAIEKSHHVIADVGAGAEVAMLDWIESNDLSEILGGHLAFHVVLGSLDSVGTALSIASRSPGTPMLLYLNHKEPEHRALVDVGYGREVLDELLGLPNVVGLVDFPDLRAAFGISSRLSATLHDVQTHHQATLIERQICRKALQRLESVWAPAAAWFPW